MSELKQEYKPNDVKLYRSIGKMLSETNGSEHYEVKKTQPIELVASSGLLEGFCLASAIKYSSRFTETRNKKDIIKAIDMLQIFQDSLEIEATKTLENKSEEE